METFVRGDRRNTAAAFGWLVCTCVAVCASAPAWASNVGLSGGVSRTPATSGNPATGSNSGGVSGLFVLSDRWTVDGAFGVTKPRGVGDASNPLSAKEKEANIYALGLNLTWTPGAGDTTVTVNEDGETDEEDVPVHWNFGAGLSVSPKAIELTATEMTLQDTLPGGKTASYDAPTLLKVLSSSIGGSLWSSWETGGDSNWETAVTLSASPNVVSTTQTVEEYVDRQGKTLASKDLLAACSGASAQSAKKACKRLMPLLKAQSATIVTVPISLSIEEIIYEKTEVTVSGTYFAYNKDPNEVGYFNLANQGKQAGGSAPKGVTTASFGTGVAIAPFAWNSGVSVAHKFGPVKLTAMVGHAAYYDAGGAYNSFGLRASWKINDTFRLNVAGATQSDVDEDGVATRSWSATAALKYTF